MHPAATYGNSICVCLALKEGEGMEAKGGGFFVLKGFGAREIGIFWEARLSEF